MVNALKLPFSFDADLLKADLELVGAEEWVPHFNRPYYEGVWSGVSLRSVTGKASSLFPDPSRTDFYADTPLMERCGYFRRVTGAFECGLESVRLLKLGPGARIREHSDFDLGFEYRIVRVHIPVRTSAEVEFVVGGERVSMGEGECWYLDLSLDHSVANAGEGDRVHLVVDCVVNDWVRSVFK